MGGSPSQPTQTTQQVLSPEQRELLNITMPTIKQYAAAVPQRYQGPTTAGFTPEQTAGQNMALGAVPSIDTIGANAASANNFYTSGNIWDPAANPHLQGAIDAAVRPVYTNLTERALPAIRSGSIQSGNFGGSRQGIAEGAAIRDAGTIAADTASKIAQDQYSTNVNAQQRAIAMAPTVQGAQTAGAQVTSGVGDVRQAMDQARINSGVNAFNFDQYAPFMNARDILSIMQGLPGGSTVSTGNTPTPNKAMSALGGAATGAALGSALMPGIGTGVGAAGGALLPFLFG
jgi:hypothetical protein